MAVAFDAVGPSSSGTSAAGTTSLSWSHTCTGSNLYLIAGVSVGNGASTDTVTCTYNSVSMTKLGLQSTNNTANGYVVLFGLASPATGANTVAFSCLVTGDITAGSASFTGVGSIGTPVAAFGSSATPSVTVGSVASTSMVVAATCCGSSYSSVTAGTSQWIKNLNGNTGAGNNAGATNTGSGSVAVTWSSGSDFWGVVGVELQASGGGGTTPNPPQPIVMPAPAPLASVW